MTNQQAGPPWKPPPWRPSSAGPARLAAAGRRRLTLFSSSTSLCLQISIGDGSCACCVPLRIPRCWRQGAPPVCLARPVRCSAIEQRRTTRPLEALNGHFHGLVPRCLRGPSTGSGCEDTPASSGAEPVGGVRQNCRLGQGSSGPRGRGSGGRTACKGPLNPSVHHRRTPYIIDP